MTNGEKIVLKLYNEGLSDNEISEASGLSINTVACYRKKLSLRSYVLINRDKEDLVILNALKNGMSMYEITKKFNCYSDRTRRIAKENNINLTTWEEMVENRRIVSHNPFTKASEESEYWLGILASDGCVYKNRIRLGLQESDYSHVVKFRDYINPELKITKTVKNKKHVMFNVAFRSPEIATYLDSIGITQKKSLTINYSRKITTSFLRGVVDGDGYIRNNGTELSIATGSIVFAEQLKQFISETFQVNCTIHKTKPHLYCVGVYGRKQTWKVLSIYENASIYLDRKYYKAISIRNNGKK